MEPVYFNTCYSHVGPEYGISIVGIFRPTDTAITEMSDAGGVSPRGSSAVPSSSSQRMPASVIHNATGRSGTMSTVTLAASGATRTVASAT